MVSTLPSCTVAGLSVGAIVDASTAPAYEHHPPSEARSLEPGTKVRLRRTRGTPVEGRLLGVTPSRPRSVETHVVVETDEGIDLYPESKLAGIDTRRGKYGWLYGGAAGLVLDIVAVALLAASASSIGDLSASPAAQENGGGW
jgi:hypothetical protein